MGKPDKCFITDLETLEVTDGRDVEIQYCINPPGLKKIKLMFEYTASGWTDIRSINFRSDKKMVEYIVEKIATIKHILSGLILNNKWPLGDIILNSKMIDKIIYESDYPKTPKEKIDNLFVSLCRLQKFDGQEITLINKNKGEYYFDDIFYLNKLYFQSLDEYLFYLNTLKNINLIVIEYSELEGEDNLPISINITYEGLEEYMEIRNEGKLSNNCFIAMSFDKEEDSIFFEAIKPACEETGFVAKRIDYEHYSSETTINDAIISLLKQCKFCIADFTKQKYGVYFEAGYALGRSMKVIYTCRKDFFDKTHFDTNHFPHIIYETREELKKKLIDKINAFIKD
jgi:hypothetical protein